MSTLSYRSIFRLFLWMYSVPVLSFWVILSFIPLAGIFIEGATLVSVIGDAVFLSFGFGGLFSIYVLGIYFAAGPEQRTQIYGVLRERIGLVSAYATLWLVGYWLFKFLVV